MHSLTKKVDSLRPEIEISMESEYPYLPGIYFSKLLKDDAMGIQPCLGNDIIVYYKNKNLLHSLLYYLILFLH